MCTDEKKCHTRGAESLGGVIWITGWLFTIGFAKLIWWKALLAVLLWAYYLGAALKGF